MPAITEQRILPKSALRHRPIGDLPQEIPIWTVRTSRTTAPKAKREPHTTGGPPSVAKTHIPKRQTLHWMVPAGLAMATTILVILLLQMLWSWATLVSDGLRYGYPRTTQMDAFVGHEQGKTPSHFIALNLHGHVQVIEFPGGDSSHAKVYLGPLLSGEQADLAPVTLQFIDRNGDHLPDMVIQCNGVEIWYKNTNGSFLPF